MRLYRLRPVCQEEKEMKKKTEWTFILAIAASFILLYTNDTPLDANDGNKYAKEAVNNLEGSTLLMEKPYFSITIESNLAVGYLFLNGQLLYAAEMMPLKFDLPVNHWIRKGDNELRMMLAPIDEQGKMGKFPSSMKCTLTLKIRPSGSRLSDNVTIAALSFVAKDPSGIESNTPEGRLDSKKAFTSAKNGDVLIDKVKKVSFQDVGAIVTRIITLPEIGLPEWKFFRSDNITNVSGPDIDGSLDDNTTDKLKKELLPVYRKIWSALEARTVDSVLPLFEERNKETDAAFFKKPGETGRRLAEELNERASDSTIQLYPITENNVILRVSENNKLVRLAQNNEKPLLCFSDTVNHVGYYYDVIFRKSGNKWIITR
jgi:hypothetical protein